MQAKQDLRRELRARRKEFVANIPQTVRSLILNRPPGAIAEHLREYRVLGCYVAHGFEAPSLGWIRWFHENGWQIALPRFSASTAAMEFRRWNNPFDEGELEPGLLDIPQPRADALATDPAALIVPLIGFTADCQRLGQGGGHYDRWLAEHADLPTIGLAWDVQQVDELPLEPHDQPLSAVVTPTRIHWAIA